MFYSNILLDREESEADQFNRLNYQTIPEKLWKIFPSHGSYLVHILKFCGYQSRETILKLKDEKEVAKMFEFAAQHHDLLDQEEKILTFGIFARKPTAVSILPGLTPVFRRFIKEVEDLVPKPKQSASKFFQKSTSSPSSSLPAAASKSSANKEVTIESITARMENWLDKEKKKNPHFSTSVEDVMKKCLISITENGQFRFKCKQQGCSEVFMLTISSGFCNLSNVQRHITKSCWLSSKTKAQKASTLSNSKTQSKIQTSLIGKFTAVSTSSKVKQHPDGVHFDVNEPPNKVTKTSDLKETKSPCRKEENASNDLSPDSKNL